MQAWLESVAPGYGQALMWTLLALIGLLVLLIAIRIVRGLSFGTFVAGGRNRKTRLAVMDATAVDSHRRLVLVRRDDVEHLILIGGPSDVVVEQNIRMVAATTRRPPAVEEAIAPPPPAVAPSPAQRPAPPKPAPAPAAPLAAPVPAPRPPVAAPPPPRPVAPAPAAPAVESATNPAPVAEPRHSSIAQPEPPRAPAYPTSPAHAAPAAPKPAASVQTLRPVTVAPEPQAVKHDLDEALLEELEVSLENERRPGAPAQRPDVSATERSLDEEMSRLLSDLSGPNRQ